MKTIGLLGGMSWESSQVYYRELNQRINQALGGLHSAQMVMINVDFAPIEQLMLAGDWVAVSNILIKHCLQLQGAGADFIVIATNTMHKLAPAIEAAIQVPLLHIADAVGQSKVIKPLKTVGLLGTAFTMEAEFYTTRLNTKYGLDTLIPDDGQRLMVNQIIFDELCKGQFNTSSKQQYLKVINDMAQQGAQAIVLACTEIGLLVQQDDTDVTLIDATEEHIKMAVHQALL